MDAQHDTAVSARLLAALAERLTLSARWLREIADADEFDAEEAEFHIRQIARLSGHIDARVKFATEALRTQPAIIKARLDP